MRGFAQDLRYSFRQLKKSPVFAITAVLTLALGIGANVAVFSVMNATLLNPSGVPHADGVVALRAGYNQGDLGNINLSPPDFEDASEGKEVFTSAAVMNGMDYNYSPDGGGTPELLRGAKVTWQWFDVFWAQPMMGRVFRPEEDQPGAEHEVVLAYSAWQKRFGGDPHILGRKLQLNQESYEVVGVMGPEFAWPNRAEMWTPLALTPSRYTDPNYRFNEYLFGVARLRQGKTLADANTYLTHRTQQVYQTGGRLSDYAKSAQWHQFAMPLIEFVSGKMQKPLAFLLGAVALVLLIACANIAGLQLARASGRQREVSIQIALGGSRGRLIRQALSESVLLALSGALLGVVVAKLSIPLLLALAPPSIGRTVSAPMDARMLLFVAGIGVLCALLCGTAPSWHMTHIRWFQALQEGGRSDSASPARQRTRSALVVVEIAIAMLLLFGAGLLVRSMNTIQQVETGMQPHGVMTAALTLPKATYKTDEQQANFYNSLEEQLKQIPGVQHAAIVDSIPFSNGGGSASFFIEGKPVANGALGPHANIRSVSPEYFETLGIPLMRGRFFTSADRAKTQLVVIIDDVLARQYFGDSDPIGQHINFGDPPDKDPWREIVGIVHHARATSLENDTNEGFYYFPMAQAPNDSSFIAVKTNGAAAGLVGPIRNAVRNVDPSQALYDVKAMDERVDDSLIGRRFLVVLLSVFAGLALLLSAVGLYGVIAYSVRLRTRELGVRMALGAQRSDVLKLVLGHGMQLAVAGLVIGLGTGLALSKVFESLLFKVSVFNPVALLSTCALLMGTVLFASYLPARRAAKLDPIRTLRDE
ncbi:ABC efflux pump, inner membrane subunit [Candidatus Koribacter versatilis Ellin345]|uniref:ABC efflux pump, inner membrane subunit n=1 Tax=Koribacter versatilis (strain Ellin345) TaxID=204669 RepID=Q1IUS7_KORVE|nr:ABC transporter permease [Candidatus Koribacter versatilis]ABF39373.1 ABC efflux pump, inner membrane subunit [Candidatus Koribacter versatilis Ellin345]